MPMSRGVCPLCGAEWKTGRRRKTPFCDPCTRRVNANRLNMKRLDRSCVHYWIIDACDHGFCWKCGESEQFSPKHVKGFRANSKLCGTEEPI